MPSATATAGDVTLTCDIARVGDDIVFTYSLANAGRGAVVVMDAAAVADAATGRSSAAAGAVTTWLGEDGQAQVLKGTPPLPATADPEAPPVALGVRLEPGKRLERRHSERLPLAEHSPYVPVDTLDKYRLAPIQGVALTVEVLPALPGLVAEARDIARGWWRIVDPEAAAGLALRLTCAFRARGLFMLARRDDYPRPALPKAPVAGVGAPEGSAV
jgi:hypothetical protein